MAVLKQEDPPAELFKTFEVCATSALMAASGMVALAIACQSASESPVFATKFDSVQVQRIRALLTGLGATVQDAWIREIKELLEIIVVLAAELAPSADEEVRFRQWAKGLLLDTRPMSIMEDDTRADVEIDQTPEPQRQRVRKPHSSKEIYLQERLESLVSRAILKGVDVMEPVLESGQLVIWGTGEKGKIRLGKLRGSHREAIVLCKQANEEIRKCKIAEPQY
jgi:hypothetical protein